MNSTSFALSIISRYIDVAYSISTQADMILLYPETTEPSERMAEQSSLLNLSVHLYNHLYLQYNNKLTNIYSFVQDRYEQINKMLLSLPGEVNHSAAQPVRSPADTITGMTTGLMREKLIPALYRSITAESFVYSKASEIIPALTVLITKAAENAPVNETATRATTINLINETVARTTNINLLTNAKLETTAMVDNITQGIVGKAVSVVPSMTRYSRQNKTVFETLINQFITTPTFIQRTSQSIHNAETVLFQQSQQENSFVQEVSVPSGLTQKAVGKIINVIAESVINKKTNAMVRQYVSNELNTRVWLKYNVRQSNTFETVPPDATIIPPKRENSPETINQQYSTFNRTVNTNNLAFFGDRALNINNTAMQYEIGSAFTSKIYRGDNLFYKLSGELLGEAKSLYSAVRSENDGTTLQSSYEPVFHINNYFTNEQQKYLQSSSDTYAAAAMVATTNFYSQRQILQTNLTAPFGGAAHANLAAPFGEAAYANLAVPFDKAAHAKSVADKYLLYGKTMLVPLTRAQQEQTTTLAENSSDNIVSEDVRNVITLREYSGHREFARVLNENKLNMIHSYTQKELNEALPTQRKAGDEASPAPVHGQAMQPETSVSILSPYSYGNMTHKTAANKQMSEDTTKRIDNYSNNVLTEDIDIVTKTVKKAVTEADVAVEPKMVNQADLEQLEKLIQIDKIADKVYQALQARLRSERMRRGML